MPHWSTPRWRSYIWPRLTPGLPQASGYTTDPFGPAPHPSAPFLLGFRESLVSGRGARRGGFLGEGLATYLLPCHRACFKTASCCDTWILPTAASRGRILRWAREYSAASRGRIARWVMDSSAAPCSSLARLPKTLGKLPSPLRPGLVPERARPLA